MDVRNNPWIMPFVIFICFSLKSHVSLGADTISAKRSLSGDQTIVSAGKVFELGFFKAGNSSNYYIGMWYYRDKVSEQTIVWVANRETPVSDRFSSELRISDGNLALFNESKIPIWSTNLSSSTSRSVEAVLGNDGNLVLRDGTNPSVSPLWQSIDFPAHTWLPGAKIGLNKINNRSTRLVSWKNKDDPAPGLFSLELDPNHSQYLIFWNRSIRYWTSGEWNGHIFSLVPEMRLNYIYNFSYVSNDNESYFTYSVYSSTIISRFVMDYGGQIQQKTWSQSTKAWFLFWSQPKTPCEVYAFCGAFGSCNTNSQPFCNCTRGFNPKSKGDWDSEVFSGGCVRAKNLQCGNSSAVNGKSDRFFPSYNMKLPANPQIVAAGSAQECASTCLTNCSCTAYAFDGGQCSAWSGDLLSMQQVADGTDGKSIYIRLAASEFSSSKNNKGKLLGGVVGSVVIVSLVALVLLIFFTRRKAVKMGTAVEGRRNSEQSEDGKVKFFPSYVASQINQEDGDFLSLLDHRLEGDADLEELTRICKVACWCIQDEETQRPSMGQVVQILEGVVNVNPPPTPRSLRVFDCQENIIFFTESSSNQSSRPQSHTSTASTQSKSTTSNTSPRS
ncbi:hypothetical protein SADUNF_Sadunf19G0109600 [Salix dunnii]|uniref:Uncharacterized protein n=1 Tax=Salix dunnii TaxID=1413687 RepID=A0A835J2B5_9ROSI|nr:hypothetical protein SADUNF_Sadunf19G0109600 [Salix dunnii]